MKKIYYEETLGDSSIVVTDSYVRYRDRRMRLDQVIPIKSISSVNCDVHFNNMIEYLRGSVAFSCALLTVLFMLDTFIVNFLPDLMGILVLVLIMTGAGFVFSVMFTARYAIYIDSSSGEYIGILRKKFKNKDPQQLHEAIISAIEENGNQ